MSKSKEWDEVLNGKMAELLDTNLYRKLREETGYTDYDRMEMSDVATYISWAEYHGIELKFPVSEKDLKWCLASADQFLYEWFVASDEFWRLGSNEMLKLINELIEITAFGASPAEETFEIV